ncbi:hypothetical protein [Reinekea sp.]|jgi:hypothetical protein|uniref:hypothetical protein n=1 Tax=Reinekea sp. TaxID=1970455 RepID=UPI002A817A58|nr:hypothetical protein [Reinekea sp.]
MLKRAVVVNSLCCLVVSQSAAQVDWRGSVAGQVSGADSQTSAQLIPTLGLVYQGTQFDLSTQLSTRLDSAQTEVLPDTWQSQNRLTWTALSGRISGDLGFAHQQIDPPLVPANRQAKDDLSTSLSVVVAQTLSLFHRIDLSGQYRNRRSGRTLNNHLQEWRGLGNYGLNWQRGARTRWRTGVGFNISDSGAQSVNANLGWQWQSVRFGYQLRLVGRHTEQVAQSADNLAWNGTVTYQSSGFGISLGGEQSQTDAISFFSLAQIDTPIEQQSQLQVDQLTFSLFGVQPVDSITLRATYLMGQRRSLFNLKSSAPENPNRLAYQQLDTSLVWQWSSQSNSTLAWQGREENGVASAAGTAAISRTLNRNWSVAGSLQRDLTGANTPLNWSMSMTYQR